MSVIQLKSSLLTLPSRGIANVDNNLIDGSQVRIRPLLGGDQSAMSARGVDAHTLYFTLIDRILLEPKPFDINSLLVSDANSIMIAVRIMSFGAKYDFKYQCSNCNHNGLASIDFSQIQFKYADEIDDYSPDNIELELESGHTINMHQLRLRDEQVVQRTLRDRQKRNPQGIRNIASESQYLRLAQLIDTISEYSDTDSSKTLGLTLKLDYLQNKVTWSDIERIQEKLASSDTGMVPDHEEICPRCGWSNDLTIVLNEEFFRPSRR